jgi:hypothetical protein
MMKHKLTLLLLPMLAAFLLLENCSPFTRVYGEIEPGVNLSQFHTYKWLDNTSIKAGNSGPSWLSNDIKDKIRAAVEHEMDHYGYKPCDEKPDLMLHYHVVIKNEVLYMRDWSCGGVFEAPGQYDQCNRVQPVHYQEGTLILDFIETKKGNQVWRGAAVGILENLKPEAADARIEAAVKAIFTKYPEKPIPTLMQ